MVEKKNCLKHFFASLKEFSNDILNLKFCSLKMKNLKFIERKLWQKKNQIFEHLMKMLRKNILAIKFQKIWLKKKKNIFFEALKHHPKVPSEHHAQKSDKSSLIKLFIVPLKLSRHPCPLPSLSLSFFNIIIIFSSLHARMSNNKSIIEVDKKNIVIRIS